MSWNLTVNIESFNNSYNINKSFIRVKLSLIFLSKVLVGVKSDCKESSSVVKKVFSVDITLQKNQFRIKIFATEISGCKWRLIQRPPQT